MNEQFDDEEDLSVLTEPIYLANILILLLRADKSTVLNPDESEVLQQLLLKNDEVFLSYQGCRSFCSTPY